MKFKNLKERKGNKNPSLELAKCNRRLFEREREEGRRKGGKNSCRPNLSKLYFTNRVPPPIRTLSMHQRSIIIHIAYPPLLSLLSRCPSFLPSFPPPRNAKTERNTRNTHTHTHTSLCGMSKGDERRKRKPRGFCVHRCSYAKTTVRLRPFQPSLSLRPSLSLSLSLSFPPLRRFSRSSVATTRRVPTVLKLDGGFFHDD